MKSIIFKITQIYKNNKLFQFNIVFLRIFGKSIFPGKNYNDILAQNRACVFDFNDSLYEKMSPPGDYLNYFYQLIILKN